MKKIILAFAFLFFVGSLQLFAQNKNDRHRFGIELGINYNYFGISEYWVGIQSQGPLGLSSLGGDFGGSLAGIYKYTLVKDLALQSGLEIKLLRAGNRESQHCRESPQI